MAKRPASGSDIGPTSVEITTVPTQEDQRVPGGDHITCFTCGVPKEPDEFDGDSVLCRRCVTIRHNEATMSESEQKSQVFNTVLKKLRETSVPALPAGVQAAKDILSGRTSSEILAKLIVEVEKSDRPSFKQLLQALTLYQRAEIAHDQQLTETNAYQGLDPEDLTAALQKHVVSKMQTDASFKRWLITEMIERVDGFLQEVVAIAQSRTVATDDVLVMKAADGSE